MREYEAEQMSTIKDEDKHRGHGKRKAPPQWREMKTKEKGNENEVQVQKPVTHREAHQTRMLCLHTPSPCCIVLRRRKPLRLGVSW
jgi:hypothetical protein